MTISKGYVKYTDDRDKSITEMVLDSDSSAKEHWHDDTWVDANGIMKSYVFHDENHEALDAMKKRHDAEFKAWLEGGEVA